MDNQLMGGKITALLKKPVVVVAGGGLTVTGTLESYQPFPIAIEHPGVYHLCIHADFDLYCFFPETRIAGIDGNTIHLNAPED